jgi:hypothetical protein
MAGLGSDEIDRLWAVRQHRQEALDRENPPETLYVLDEAALRRRVGRGHLMRHQLEWIKESATKPHTSIQIMPFSRGAHPGMAGNFILLEFADPNLEDLVHLENINQITIRDDTELIARYLDRFERLQELALSSEDSLDFLDMLIPEMSPPLEPSNSTKKEAS